MSLRIGSAMTECPAIQFPFGIFLVATRVFALDLDSAAAHPVELTGR